MVKTVLTAFVGLCLGGMFINASVHDGGDGKLGYGLAAFVVAMTTLYAVSGKTEDSADNGSEEDESA